jgi:uncharacterized membrane protein YedE/YeeE
LIRGEKEMLLFRIVSKYFWAIAILITCSNVLFFKGPSKSDIEEDPEASQDYNKLIRGYLFWMNLPWIVMGIGCTIGGVPTTFHYCRPRDGNSFVIAWWVIVFILYILDFYWIFFCKGAEKVVKYGMFSYYSFGKNGKISNPKMVKLIHLLFPIVGLIVAIAMWTTDTPLPPFLTGD